MDQILIGCVIGSIITFMAMALFSTKKPKLEGEILAKQGKDGMWRWKVNGMNGKPALRCSNLYCKFPTRQEAIEHAQLWLMDTNYTIAPDPNSTKV